MCRGEWFHVRVCFGFIVTVTAQADGISNNRKLYVEPSAKPTGEHQSAAPRNKLQTGQPQASPAQVSVSQDSCVPYTHQRATRNKTNMEAICVPNVDDICAGQSLIIDAHNDATGSQNNWPWMCLLPSRINIPRLSR